MTDSVVLFMSKETLRGLERLKGTLGPRKFTTVMDQFFEHESAKAAGHVSDTMLSGQRLKRRTGALARSIVGRGVRFGKAPAMRVGVFRGAAAEDYARIQEKGGVVKAKPGKALAIPMKHAKTPAGVPRWDSPRDAPVELKLIPFTSGGTAKAGLFDARSLEAAERYDGTIDMKKAKLYYLLVKQVRIRGKHYLRDGFRDFFPILMEDLAEFVVGKFRTAFWTRGVLR